jgi:hypothetical protein
MVAKCVHSQLMRSFTTCQKAPTMIKQLCSVAAISFLAFPTTAHADEPTATAPKVPIETTVSPSASNANEAPPIPVDSREKFARDMSLPPSGGNKSRLLATLLGLGGTVIPIAAVGTYLGATTHSGKAEDYATASMGVALIFLPSAGRWYAHEAGLLHMGIRTAGIALAYFVGGTGDEPNATSGGGIALGVAIVAADIIYDIATTHRVVSRYNQRHSNVAVAPLLRHDTQGSLVGLAIGGSF